MTDRFLTWVGSGLLAAGVTAAAVAGAGVASADEGDGATSSTSAASSKTADTADTAEADSAPTKQRGVANRNAGPARGGAAADDSDSNGSDDKDSDDTGGSDDTDETDDAEATDLDETPADEDVDTAVAADPVEVADSVSEVEPVALRSPATVTAKPVPAPARSAVSAADEAPAPGPSLLNVVGTFAWGLFDLLTKAVDPAPTVPPGSSLTVGRSTLEIDCGDGYTAEADWYFPTEGEPDKFIYFQHGFPARAGFYNVTLQHLAERNNAVVVAPTITSNIFACDACAASGEPMQAAVADLFTGDRATLLASARTAGYEGDLPKDFVFAGQSAGASLAIAAAGYYYENAPDDEKSDMRGVLLYDVSALGGATEGNALTNGLRKLPTSVPVLNIAAEPNTLNSQSSANAVFLEERPEQFNGVQLVGGAHSDGFQSDILFGIPQLIVNVAFGASTPENAEAVQVLTSGWLVDMYAGRVYDPDTRTGIYGVPGAPGEVVVDVPTDKGLAQAYVLPVRSPTPTPIESVVNVVFGWINANYFATCVPVTVSAAAVRSCPL